MNDILKLIKNSKTAKSGIITIVVGILIMFGAVGPDNQQATIDDIGQKTQNIVTELIGLFAMVNGVVTIKGRNDAEKKIKELNNEEPG